MRPLSPRQVNLHGHTLSYVDSGSGEAILFVHGLLGSHRNWRYLVDRLDNTNRVIVPDLFGHGASEKHEGDYSPSAQAATLRGAGSGRSASDPATVDQSVLSRLRDRLRRVGFDLRRGEHGQ